MEGKAMGLFRKNVKKNDTTENNQHAGNKQNADIGHPRETNEINNRELKEKLANTALQLLVQGEDYDQLAYTSCEFGYLFHIEGHGLEALLKLTTDKGVFYFAAQKESFMRLNFNEALFQSTTKQFLSLHQ